MKLLVELPELIEDAIMITPAIENLLKHYRDAEVTFVGSSISSQFFENDKRIKSLVVEETNKSIFSLLSLFRLAKSVGTQDLVVSFKKDFHSKFFLFFIDCENKINFVDNMENIHKVEKYNNFINTVLQSNYRAGDLMLKFKPQWNKKPTFGIHAGSTYANVKRWNAKEFAKVAVKLSSKYDVVLLGGRNEIDICSDIEAELKANGIKNYENLAGKTSVSQLVEKIAGLDLFLTIDSGPMQIAAVYRVNTIVVPTSYEKIELISQWKNPWETIIYKHVDPYSEDENEDYIPTSEDVLSLFKF